MSEKSKKENSDENDNKTKKSKSNKDKDDFVEMSISLLKNINFKLVFFIFLIGMIIFSDMFINGVINKFSNSIYGECTTTKGTIIQLTFLVIGYVIVDLLNKSDII
jgi:hypothetical protein